MPHKQTRKIIRVGNSLAVTIPKAWLSYFDLSEKDEVTIFSNGAIIIKPRFVKEETQESTINFECSNLPSGKGTAIA
jgi:antitoxin component of MazEF toxin-antitoxin module